MAFSQYSDEPSPINDQAGFALKSRADLAHWARTWLTWASSERDVTEWRALVSLCATRHPYLVKWYSLPGLETELNAAVQDELERMDREEG